MRIVGKAKPLSAHCLKFLAGSRFFVAILILSLSALYSCRIGSGINSNLSPWPTNLSTGVPEGMALRLYSGPSRSSAPGQVFERLIIDKRIYVLHPNVIFRHCLLRGADDAYYVVYANPGSQGLLIDRCDIRKSIVIGDGFTARGNHIRAPDGGYMNDGFMIAASDVIIEGNLIEGLAGSPGAHLDGIQVLNGRNIIIRGNWIEATSREPIAQTAETGGGVNAAIFLSPYEGRIDDIVVEGNMLIQDEGYYPLRIYDVGGKIRVTDNVWSHSRHGLSSPYHFLDCAPSVWRGNVWDSGYALD